MILGTSLTSILSIVCILVYKVRNIFLSSLPFYPSTSIGISWKYGFSSVRSLKLSGRNADEEYRKVIGIIGSTTV